MKTLGDRLRNVWINYIAPSKEDLEVGKKEVAVQHPMDEQEEYKDSSLTKKLSMTKCRITAEQCPLFMKGARKKAMDGVRAWHVLESEKQKTKPAEADLKIIRAFEKRTNLKVKCYNARTAKFIYGDGYLLITFENDEKTKLHDPPAEGAIPWKVEIYNSEFIKKLDYYPNQLEKYKKLHVRHFLSIDNNQNEVWIHPDRLVHFVNNPLPHKRFGNSSVNLLRNIIKSMINVDIACGEILSWFAHGSYDIEEQGLEEPSRKFWEKIAKKHPGTWIHGEEVKIKSINPVAIDPKPFYEYLVLKVAAAFIMPTHVLTGIQVGKVTGAEIGVSDYVKDLKDDQDLELTPLLERLYIPLLKGHGRTWKYNIVWNPIYIDELAEAEIMQKRIDAAEKALNGSKGGIGFVNRKEARLMYNKGQIELDEAVPDDIPEKTPEKPQDSSDDDDDEDKDDKKETSNEPDLYKYQIDIATKAMIQKRKAIAAREKALGEEQDKND